MVTQSTLTPSVFPTKIFLSIWNVSPGEYPPEREILRINLFHYDVKLFQKKTVKSKTTQVVNSHFCDHFIDIYWPSHFTRNTQADMAC